MAAQQGAGADTGGGGANGTDPAAHRASGPQAGRLDATQVRAMFDGIAGVYDALNTAMTAGLHHRWRARAADLAHVGAGDRVLDVATGTGDLALELATRVAPGGEVIGSDFAEAMLDRAREKAASSERAGVRPRFEWADALELPYGEDSFDAATVGFGARNFADLAGGLAEMVRVVRPGGRVVVLEITTPVKPPLSTFYELWFDRLVPLLGRATQGAARVSAALRGGGSTRGSASAAETIGDAYTYLPSSVKRFPAPRGARGGARARGPAGDLLRAARGRHRRDPRRHGSARARVSAIGGTRTGIAARDVDGLDAIMHRGGEALRERMVGMERHLERVTAEAGEPLAPYAHAAIGGGGKRLRPLLVVLAAESAGGPPPGGAGEERMLRAAVAVELVHSATLVHDDLIDGAQLRRGRPTVASRRRTRGGGRDR